VCSGGAAGYFEDAIAAGVDLYVTGEPSEMAQAIALESGVAFIAAGHHNTERHGPARLAKYLRENLELDATFVDIPNPV
jgi:putative NIF3 family GTP cyclohydrolase 1 type 2